MSTTKTYLIRFRQLKCADGYETTKQHERAYVVYAQNKGVARQIAHAMLVEDVRWKYGAVSLEDADKLADEDWRVTFCAVQRTSSNEYRPKKTTLSGKKARTYKGQRLSDGVDHPVTVTKIA